MAKYKKKEYPENASGQTMLAIDYGNGINVGEEIPSKVLQQKERGNNA